MWTRAEIDDDEVDDDEVDEGEIEDGEVEEDEIDDRGGAAAGVDNEIEVEGQPAREGERPAGRSPVRDVRPGAPGPRRDSRGRGRTGGRWR